MINRLKEAVCVVTGHTFGEKGSKKCKKHAVTYSVYAVCKRCGAVERRSKTYCHRCMTDLAAFVAKTNIQGKSIDFVIIDDSKENGDD